MKRITIGGVPEHFNLPWHLAIEEGKFKQKGVDLQWKEFSGGTGAMCAALRDGSIDAAIILTEGIIKDIINGNPSKIVKVYVESPLLWGIHVGAQSKFTTIKDLEEARIAISRFGSGSQLMAIVNAVNQGFDLNKLQYEIVNNLNGGIKALTENQADYFMWEHFTTKPLVDQGIFRRIDSITTPWPCFVMAVRNDFLENKPAIVKIVIDIINTQLKSFEKEYRDKKMIHLFSERYQQQEEDVKEWLSITKWNRKKNISKEIIDSIQNKLAFYSVIKNTILSGELIKKLF